MPGKNYQRHLWYCFIGACYQIGRPNPVSNLLNIKISNVQNQTASLSLYDLTGRLISNTESSIRNQKISYNTSSLVTGVYFVLLKLSDGRQATIKFIK